jgi:hypothetical protein
VRQYQREKIERRAANCIDSERESGARPRLRAEAIVLVGLAARLHRGNRRNPVRPSQKKGRSHEGQVHDDLPEHGVFGNARRSDFDECFQQVDGRDANERCGKFDLKKERLR